MSDTIHPGGLGNNPANSANKVTKDSGIRSDLMLTLRSVAIPRLPCWFSVSSTGCGGRGGNGNFHDTTQYVSTSADVVDGRAGFDTVPRRISSSPV